MYIVYIYIYTYIYIYIVDIYIYIYLSSKGRPRHILAPSVDNQTHHCDTQGTQKTIPDHQH